MDQMRYLKYVLAIKLFQLEDKVLAVRLHLNEEDTLYWFYWKHKEARPTAHNYDIVENISKLQLDKPLAFTSIKSSQVKYQTENN